MDPKLVAFLKKAQKEHGWIIDTVDAAKYVSVERIPFNVFALDYATYGGIPRGRIILLYGEKAGGKTSTALRLVTSAQGMGLQCGFMDQEHAYNERWSSHLGVNQKELILSRPETAEECIDQVDALLRTAEMDLIVVDSIAAMTPSKEIEESVERWQQGLQARLVNKAVRKWVSTLNALGKSGDMGILPTILLINQVREKIGVMFGDPETTPGGRGVGFATSMEIRMWPGKVEFDKDKDPYAIAQRFKVTKSKVSPAHMSGEYKVLTVDTEERAVGGILEEDIVRKTAMKYGILKKEKGIYVFGGKELGATVEECELALVRDTDTFQELKDTTFSYLMG